MTDWRCAGCGKPSPDRIAVCDCPTNVVTQPAGRGEWKRPANAGKITDHCHALIGSLYEESITQLTTEDVDLIKSALKKYADAHL
jgi:hypothetical protein